MNETARIWPPLVKQAIPTRLQALISFVAALVILLFAQSDAILAKFGLNNEAYATAGKALMSRLDVVLGSQLASNVVLVTFWATIGLVTYLIVWSAINVINDIRDEVTLETEYANRGHWRGVWETIALKAVTFAVLAGYMATFKYTFALWIALSAPVDERSLTQTVSGSFGAWVGLSIEIYFLMLLIILLVTPWYRATTFTD